MNHSQIKELVNAINPQSPANSALKELLHSVEMSVNAYALYALEQKVMVLKEEIEETIDLLPEVEKEHFTSTRTDVLDTVARMKDGEIPIYSTTVDIDTAKDIWLQISNHSDGFGLTCEDAAAVLTTGIPFEVLQERWPKRGIEIREHISNFDMLALACVFGIPIHWTEDSVDINNGFLSDQMSGRINGLYKDLYPEG